jgi:hypothetical protein
MLLFLSEARIKFVFTGLIAHTLADKIEFVHWWSGMVGGSTFILLAAY